MTEILHVFGPQIFWVEVPPNFWTWIIKFSFRPCGQVSGRSVEGPRRTRGERIKKKLDGQGRARREAASRPKSECKVNLDILNSSCSNASKRLRKLYPRTTWRMDLRQLTAYEHFGCVSMRAITFFVCGPKFIT